MHLSRALELISVQINCFSCILVTGISLRLCGLLGGRRGDVWECVLCVLVTHFFLLRSERPARLRGQEPPDWCVSLHVIIFGAIFNLAESGAAE